MVVVLAGCDGTGKSTCFGKLRNTREFNGFNFIKESYTSNVDKKEIRALYTVYKASDNDVTIYDRATLLDDLVYDPVMINQQSSLIDRVGRELISQALNKCLIIYFDLDDFELTKRLEERGDDYVTVHQLNKIKHSYETVFRNFNVEPVRLDVTGLSEDGVYNKVKGVINERLENC